MRRWADVAFSGALVFIFAYAIVEGQGWRFGDKLFPLAVAAPMLALALFHLIRESVKAIQQPGRELPPGASEGAAAMGAQSLGSSEPGVTPAIRKERMQRIQRLLLWMLGSFLMLWLFGFREGLPAFVFLFLRFQSKESWLLSGIITVATGFAMHQLFGTLLHYPWAVPQIARWFGFDWPGI